jgi:2-C-methyl-D-erythritol 4-phosphate cytidylyltransferase/2-C-methyl-D-erythritol 2,4-cyclodiphosphate synthase
VTTVALIVAAGRGARFGASLPKQYLPLGGVPLLRHSASRLVNHAGIAAVRVVIDPTAQDHYAAAVAGLPVLDPIAGGATRQESVRRGLDSFAAEAPTNVLIHDGARPFPDDALVGRIIDALVAHDGAIAALPVVDTLKRGEAGGRIDGTVDRTGLWRAQTPQGFRFAAIRDAHTAAAARDDLTDDAAVAELAGLDVVLVPGSEDNLKVTTPEDLERAERLLAASGGETRVGSGFDVHRFEAGDAVVLCGHVIPHTHRLAGHSDADVALHALTDAILGAIGDGDIGQHFPPSDPQWRGAPSRLFVEHAVSRLARRGGAIVHADVTIICEAPKVSPHRDAMRAAVASLLRIELSRVSVKATTTEGLGFTGRREGIAAQATVTVRVPSR